MFPGMVFKISVRFFIIILVAPMVTGTISTRFTFHFIVEILMFCHFLDFSVVSAKITGSPAD